MAPDTDPGGSDDGAGGLVSSPFDGLGTAEPAAGRAPRRVPRRLPRRDPAGRRGGRVVLRPYRRSDDAGLAAVCLATADDGRDASALYADGAPARRGLRAAVRALRARPVPGRGRRHPRGAGERLRAGDQRHGRLRGVGGARVVAGRPAPPPRRLRGARVCGRPARRHGRRPADDAALGHRPVPGPPARRPAAARAGPGPRPPPAGGLHGHRPRGRARAACTWA